MKNKKKLIISLGIMTTLLFAAGIFLLANPENPGDAAAGTGTMAYDLAKLSGLPESTVERLYDAIGDWDRVRENIFLLKKVITIDRSISTNQDRVFEFLKKYEISDLLAVYEFAQNKALKDKDIVDMLAGIDRGESLEAILGSMEADREYKIYVPADEEQIRAWMGKGYIPEDILMADSIARSRDLSIDDILAMKTGSSTWDEIGARQRYAFDETHSAASLKIGNVDGVKTLKGDSLEEIVRESNKEAGGKDKSILDELKNSGIDIESYRQKGFNEKDLRNALRLAGVSGASISEILEYKGSGKSWEETIEKYRTKKGVEAR